MYNLCINAVRLGHANIKVADVIKIALLDWMPCSRPSPALCSTFSVSSKTIMQHGDRPVSQVLRILIAGVAVSRSSIS